MDDRTPECTVIEVIRTLHTCSRQLRGMFSEQLRTSHLTDSEFLLLWVCSQSGKQPTIQGQVVALIGLSPAQLSGLVDRLYKRGLLSLDRSDQDRRCQLLTLTDSGTAVLRRALGALGPFSQAAAELGSTAWLSTATDLFEQVVALETRLQEQPSQVTLDVTQAAVTEKGAAA
jgi:DNA-binding MarR family transcriptional regulator